MTIENFGYNINTHSTQYEVFKMKTIIVFLLTITFSGQLFAQEFVIILDDKIAVTVPKDATSVIQKYRDGWSISTPRGEISIMPQYGGGWTISDDQNTRSIINDGYGGWSQNSQKREK